MANGREISEELASVRVANIGERNGQLLRRSLQQRLEDSRPGTPARFELRCGLAIASDLQGYRQDGLISRIRFTATSDFTLVRMAPPQEVVMRGTVQRFDAFNIPENQFFSADVSRDSSMGRLVDGLVEDMVRRMVLEFRRLGEA
jgi:LPS-assembly lipoprotein